VVESTGFWYWLTDLLDDLGGDLALAHASHLKAIAAAKVIAAAELGRIAYQVLTKQEDFNGTLRGVPLHQAKSRQWPRSISPVASLGRGVRVAGYAHDWVVGRRATERI
jgi:hypothetical protein